MAEFMLVAMDQVVNDAPRFRYMSGGQVKVPLVMKAGYGFTAGWAGQHTGSLTAMFMGTPGLKVVVPSTPADAKGLMATAIRDDNPSSTCTTTCSRSSTARCRTASISFPSVRLRSAARVVT
jgi:pyruvate dehydrogenase E1 component beta subunit